MLLFCLCIADGVRQRITLEMGCYITKLLTLHIHTNTANVVQVFLRGDVVSVSLEPSDHLIEILKSRNLERTIDEIKITTLLNGDTTVVLIWVVWPVDSVTKEIILVEIEILDV